MTASDIELLQKCLSHAEHTTAARLSALSSFSQVQTQTGAKVPEEVVKDILSGLYEDYKIRMRLMDAILNNKVAKHMEENPETPVVVVVEK